MPAVYVLDLKIRQSTRRLYAGTHGRGVYSVSLETLVGTQDAENELVAHAAVYPNPAQTQLYFKSSSSEIFNGNVQLYDVMGRMVLSKTSITMPLHDLVLDVAAIPAGVYFLQAKDHAGKVVLSEKVLKQ